MLFLMKTQPINHMYKNGRKMTVRASRLPPPRFSNALSAHIFETAINYETDNQE